MTEQEEEDWLMTGLSCYMLGQRSLTVSFTIIDDPWGWKPGVFWIIGRWHATMGLMGGPGMGRTDLVVLCLEVGFATTCPSPFWMSGSMVADCRMVGGWTANANGMPKTVTACESPKLSSHIGIV